jgi:hypothetical protein
MTRSGFRALALGGCGLLLLPALGCAFAADLINPDFLRQVGFDPATIVSPPGKVVVAFTNDTDQTATFYAYVAEEVLGDQVSSGSSLTGVVAAGTTSSRAVDCPFEFLSPGRLGADLGVSSDAALVGDATGQETVAYAGTPLSLGLDFVCGDLIEIRLTQTGGGDDQDAQTQYDLRVQVHPGR